MKEQREGKKQGTDVKRKGRDGIGWDGKGKKVNEREKKWKWRA